MNDETRITDPDTGGQKGQKLAQLGAIDPNSLMDVAQVAGFGATKYARYNFTLGYRWSLSYDALQRHLHAWAAGDNLDEESGLPHLAHAAWHCLALLTFQRFGKGTDDRFPLWETSDIDWQLMVADDDDYEDDEHVDFDEEAYQAETARIYDGSIRSYGAVADEPTMGIVWPQMSGAQVDALIRTRLERKVARAAWSEAESAVHFRQITDAWHNEHHPHDYRTKCTPGVCCAAEGETVETYGT